MRSLHDAFSEALTYDTYLDQWRAHLAIPKKELDKKGRIYQFYALYNEGRSAEVAEAFTPSAEMRDALAGLDRPQHWLVLTEDWCADSAFSLPLMVRLAAMSEQITLRVLPRDENLDIMDRYLTNGGRGIPKLIAFDAEWGDELFQWGPRPVALIKTREAWMAEGIEGKVLSKLGVEWYASGGWRQVEDELLALLDPVTAA